MRRQLAGVSISATASGTGGASGTRVSGRRGGRAKVPPGGRFAGGRVAGRGWLGRWRVWVPGGRRSIALAALLAAVALPALWFVHSGAMGRWVRQGTAQALQFSAGTGLRVDEILVAGRVQTPSEALFDALKIDRGDPILGIDLQAARKRIEAISWVRSAMVERRLPNEIDLVIVERDPVALWQSHGRYFLVDRDGQIVGDRLDGYATLPLMVGDGAPDHAAGLIDLLASEPSLQARFRAAQWVGDRRWNISLNRTADPASDGIDVRLPEDEPLRAWRELARLQQDVAVLDRQIGVIDLRLPDRLVLRLAADGHTAGAPSSPAKPVGNAPGVRSPG